MKKYLPLITAILLASAGAYAAEGDDRGKDNHEEGMGGHAMHELQKQKPATAADVKKERESQKSMDRGANNHEEGTGGHALYELKKAKPATKEQLKKKAEQEKTLDRGTDNHEEGTGGHAMHELQKDLQKGK